MDETFIEWLDSLGFPLGTWLAIIIGGFTVIGGIVVAFIKLKKSYDSKLRDKTLSERSEQEFHDSMSALVTNVKNIQTELTSISETQQRQIADVNNKLDEVWKAVNESRNESTENDNLLSDKIKSYENTITNLDNKLTIMDNKTTLLIESDKEGIKSYIVDKYYAALDQGYINPHAMQTIELRYEKYLQENGEIIAIVKPL